MTGYPLLSCEWPIAASRKNETQCSQRSIRALKSVPPIPSDKRHQSLEDAEGEGDDENMTFTGERQAATGRKTDGKGIH